MAFRRPMWWRKDRGMSANGASERVIVALDGMSESETLRCAEQLKGLVWGFKVNDLLVEQGIDIVRRLRDIGHVFC